MKSVIIKNEQFKQTHSVLTCIFLSPYETVDENKYLPRRQRLLAHYKPLAELMTPYTPQSTHQQSGVGR